MDFGISTASLYPQLTEKTLQEFGKRGVSNVEIFFNTLSEIDRDYVIKLRHIVDEYGINIVSVHPFTCAFEPFMLFTGYERRFIDAVEWHKKYFDVMNTLGAKIFVFHGDRFKGKLSDEEYFYRFAVLRDLGKRFNITVAQENVERCKSRSLDFLKKMLFSLDNDVSFVFDNKQAYRSGIDANDFIDTLGKHIVHVHVSDNGILGDCIPIGEGEADLTGMLSRLKMNGFNGCAIVELYGEYLQNYDVVYESFEKLKRMKIH